MMGRMARYDHGAGRYAFENPTSSCWGAETIYVLADASDFKGVLGARGLYNVNGDLALKRNFPKVDPDKEWRQTVER